jgi:hypothetical protein
MCSSPTATGDRPASLPRVAAEAALTLGFIICHRWRRILLAAKDLRMWSSAVGGEGRNTTGRERVLLVRAGYTLANARVSHCEARRKKVQSNGFTETEKKASGDSLLSTPKK